MFDTVKWSIYIGWGLGVIIIMWFTVGLLLDVIFKNFKKVECYIESYSTYSVLPSNVKTDFSFYNLEVRYSYIIDNKKYYSTKLNHYNSISRSTRDEVIAILENRMDLNGKTFTYVCPYLKSYSILFPLQFHYIRYGLIFFAVLLVFLIFCYFLYGLN